MQLLISTTHQPATDLGYLVSKNPDRHQTFDLAFGTAHVFYPEATVERCSVALIVDVDPIGLVPGRGDADGPLTQYVNQNHGQVSISGTSTAEELFTDPVVSIRSS
jgi:hypothetical protein